MTEASRQPKDRNYNLIEVLHQSSDNVESLKSYIQDANQEGAARNWWTIFNSVLESNLRVSQQAIGDAGVQTGRE